ncbi:hypothetical protein BLAT2472_50411 [Burkholderia latens]
MLKRAVADRRQGVSYLVEVIGNVVGAHDASRVVRVVVRAPKGARMARRATHGGVDPSRVLCRSEG